jgi:hypothetical protein
MYYLLAPKQTATMYGFGINTHRCVRNNIVLNEIEVMASSALSGDIRSRAELLKATLYGSATEIKDRIDTNS